MKSAKSLHLGATCNRHWGRRDGCHHSNVPPMDLVAYAVAHYAAEMRKLNALPNATETTFYPDIKAVLSAVLKSERLPFLVITGTSEAQQKGRDLPDFVLGDASLLVGVYGEVKLSDASLDELAVSTDNNDQIGRYLAQTGIVLLCNVRDFGLFTCHPGYVRDGQTPVPGDKRGRAHCKAANVDGSFRVGDVLTLQDLLSCMFENLSKAEQGALIRQYLENGNS